uniref:Fe2OG dioxygenase domain-containing protein n=1 Tax=Davidia involucrata TaxID=16924 RepID=A0A5B7AJJ6_DAVIN
MEVVSTNGHHYDWAKEVKEFDQTKAGVKGLVDAGVTKIPRFFVHPPESLQNPPPAPASNASGTIEVEFPTIDFQGLESGSARRAEIVEGIRKAASTWGFFRVVNHEVPLSVMDAMLEAVRRFHQQPTEAKMPLYSSDSSRRVRFNSNVAQREQDVACWRDLLTCVFYDDALDPEAIPLVCRKEVQEYVKYMIKMRETMSELLSEALGLSSDYLSRLECMKSESLACLYYPACPEPHLTLGTIKHSDTTFLTLLLQDNIGGLQIVHQNQWFNVPPVRGALIANIGDLMQIISNDKFKSVEHRVLAQSVGPRTSIACFFTASSKAAAKPFGPIKELLSEDSPPEYREFMCREYYEYYKMKGTNVASALPHFKL